MVEAEQGGGRAVLWVSSQGREGVSSHPPSLGCAAPIWAAQTCTYYELAGAGSSSPVGMPETFPRVRGKGHFPLLQGELPPTLLRRQASQLSKALWSIAQSNIGLSC